MKKLLFLISLITPFIILFQSCDNNKTSNLGESDLLENYYGVYDGYCVVGLLQGDSRIKILEDEVRFNYSVSVPHNVEEAVLGTGIKRTAEESGILKNLHLEKVNDGFLEIVGDWVNNDKSVGGGNFRIFLSDKERNVITCQIYNETIASNWQCFAYIKY